MTPTHTSTDRIQAHLDLLRAVDRLLAEAEVVRDRRVALDRLFAQLLSSQAPPAPPTRREPHATD